MEKENKEKTNNHLYSTTHQIGDIFFTELAFPLDTILVGLPELGHKIRLDIESLRKYLAFLELIVLTERIIVGSAPTSEQTLSDKDIFNQIIRITSPDSQFEPLERTFREFLKDELGIYYLRPQLRIVAALREDLVRHHIIIDHVKLNTEGLPTPVALTQRYMNIVSDIRARFESHIGEMVGYGYETDEAEKMALAWLTDEFGCPMYISEACRRLGLPYYLSRWEAQLVSPYEKKETAVMSNIAMTLKEKLDEGARKELEMLSRFGVKIVLPQTPIAAKILGESNSPEDLGRVALQLRDEYASFRCEMASLQEKLIAENTTLEESIKVRRRVESLAKELWPENREGWQMNLVPISDLLNCILNEVPNVRLDSIAGITGHVISLPYKLLMTAIRRRKIRLFLSAKKNFLHSANWTQKIAKIFDLSYEDVKQACFHDLNRHRSSS